MRVAWNFLRVEASHIFTTYANVFISLIRDIVFLTLHNGRSEMPPPIQKKKKNVTPLSVFIASMFVRDLESFKKKKAKHY